MPLDCSSPSPAMPQSGPGSFAGDDFTLKEFKWIWLLALFEFGALMATQIMVGNGGKHSKQELFVGKCIGILSNKQRRGSRQKTLPSATLFATISVHFFR